MLNYSANCLAEDLCDTRYSLLCLNKTTTYINSCGCLYYQYFNGSSCGKLIPSILKLENNLSISETDSIPPNPFIKDSLIP